MNKMASFILSGTLALGWGCASRPATAPAPAALHRPAALELIVQVSDYVPDGIQIAVGSRAEQRDSVVLKIVQPAPWIGYTLMATSPAHSPSDSPWRKIGHTYAVTTDHAAFKKAIKCETMIDVSQLKIKK